MPVIEFESTDDELDHTPSDQLDCESLEAEHPRTHEGHSADVLQEGELQDPKRLRVHSPPPTADARAHTAGAMNARWEWRPKVMMGDAATAFDVAAANVFAYGNELTELGPGGEQPRSPLCVLEQRDS